MKTLQGLNSDSGKEPFLAFLDELGYYVKRGLDIPNNNVSGFLTLFSSHFSVPLNLEKTHTITWENVYFLCQLADTDWIQSSQIEDKSGFLKSCLFFAITLTEPLSASALREVIRELNKSFMIPLFLIFRYSNSISLGIARRRQNKSNEDRDVIGDVALLYNIPTTNTSAAEVRLLSMLSFSSILEKYSPTTFDALYDAWFDVLSTKKMSYSFYRELSYWYSLSLEQNLPRHDVFTTLTHVLFVWHCSCKKIIPSIFFDRSFLSSILPETLSNTCEYYELVFKPLLSMLFLNPPDTRDVFFTTSSCASFYSGSGRLLVPHFLSLPYLGGDLYAPLKSSISNAFFWGTDSLDNDGLLPILSRYVFDLDARGGDASITVDFLGAVLENISTKNSDIDFDIICTPTPLAQQIAKDALYSYLHGKLEPFYQNPQVDEVLSLLFDSQANALLPEHKEHLVASLYSISLIDLCCGSGIFLICAVELICYLLSILDPGDVCCNTLYARYKHLHAPRTTSISYNRKMFLLSHSVFGCDLSCTAIQFTKLRFFIFLLSELSPDDILSSFFILPNLSRQFANVNSLLQEAETHPSLFMREVSPEFLAALHDLLIDYFHVQTPSETSLIAERIDKLYTTYHLPQCGIFFDPATLFALTGFDVVLGNPPYTPLQSVDTSYKEALKEQHYRTYDPNGDLYVLFIEQALRHLVPRGILSYIVSNKFFRTKYGVELRKLLSEQTLLYITNLGTHMFQNSVVVSAAITVRKEYNTHKAPYVALSNPSSIVAISTERRLKGTKNVVYSDTPITIVSAKESALKERIDRIGTPLANWPTLHIARGVITGYNKAFIITSDQREQLLDVDSKSSDIIVPLLRGRDIERFNLTYSNLYLLRVGYGEGAKLEENYPAVYQHLLSHKAQLEIRGQCTTSRNNGDTGQHHWLELDNNPTHEYFNIFNADCKLVYPETTLHPRFCLDREKYYLDKTGFVMLGDGLEFLAALLSSPLITWYYKTFLSGADLYGGSYQYNRHSLLKLPLPRFDSGNTLHTSIVDYVRLLHTEYSLEFDFELSRLVRDVFNI